MTTNGNLSQANGVANPNDAAYTIDDRSKEELEMEEKNKNMKKKSESVIQNDDNASVEDDDDGWDEEEKDVNFSNTNPVSYGVKMFQSIIKSAYRLLMNVTRGYFWYLLFLVLYVAYFIYAMYKTFDINNGSSLRLLICTILGVVIVVRHHVVNGVKASYHNIVGENGLNERQKKILSSARFISRWVLYVALAAFIVWILVDEAKENHENLRGLPGLLILMFICLLLSTNPALINWHTIVWSIGLQFILAVVTLRFTVGRDVVEWVQDRFNEFFDTSVAAFVFLFGQNYLSLGIAIGAIPLVFMMTGTLALLYYFGAMQLIINFLGNIFSFIMDVHYVEAISVSGGIFVDSLLALVAVRPFLGKATKSELFTIVTSIYASLGGAFLAIIKAIGIPLIHIIPAMVISAPATFLVCKLMVPENRPKRKFIKGELVENEIAANPLDSYQYGAISGLAFAGNIIAVTFAFLCAIEWLDRTTVWFGEQAGVSDVTMQYIFSYVLYPVALAMGVHPDDCRTVAKLLGLRLLTGNLIPFQQLRGLEANRVLYETYMLATNYTGVVTHRNDDIHLGTGANTTILHGGFIEERSEVILIYCLCGYSSFLSMGFVMASIYAFVPHRRAWLSKMAIPALVAGNLANCMTGCFASMFYKPQ